MRNLTLMRKKMKEHKSIQKRKGHKKGVNYLNELQPSKMSSNQ